MAVVPQATTTTTAASTIYDEYISEISRATLGRIPVVYPLGVLRVPLLGKNSNQYDHNLRDEIGVATTLAETDEVTSTEITRSAASVSTATKAKSTFISKQNNRRSLWPEMANAAQELTSACARAIDADFLALASGFSSPIGNNATNHTVANLVTLFTAWRARVGSTMERPLIVMHGDAMRDLQLDAVSNAAAWFGAPAGIELNDATNAINQGVVATFNGVDMVSTDNIPVGDTTGWSNMMIARGNLEAAIAMPFEQEIQLETWYEAKRQGWWVIATVDYGVGEVNDLAGQTFITRT
jgi:hypothetical protein